MARFAERADTERDTDTHKNPTPKRVALTRLPGVNTARLESNRDPAAGEDQLLSPVVTKVKPNDRFYLSHSS